MKLKLKKYKIPVTIGLVIGFLLIIYLIICIIAGGKSFVSNATINGINVGNLSKKETISAIKKQYENDKEKLLLNLSLESNTYQIDMTENISYDIENEVTRLCNKYNNFFMKGYYYLFNHDYNTSIDIKDKETLENAINDSKILDYSTLVSTTYEVKEDKVIFTKGKSGKIVESKNVYNSIKKALNNYTFKDTIQITPSEISEDESVMQQIYEDLSKEAKDATLDKENNYAIVDSQYGAKYDEKEAIKKFNSASEGEKFEVDADVILPEITKEMLEKNLFKDVLGEYSTYVSGSSVRKSNVKLAGDKCNGIILLPGEEFSYNDTVGKRTKEAGFGEAAAYLNGETVQEVGGGVCQTSSTLYNAIVLSNLEITERHNHTFISSYVPIGRDATVSWNGPDFKFKNNQKYPIKLDVSYSNSRLYVKVYGTNIDGTSVEFVSWKTSTVSYNTKYENDDTLDEGTEQVKQAGANGAKAISYRKVYDKDGNLISNEKESTSSYKAHDAIVVKGTKKIETPVENTPDTTQETPENNTTETDNSENNSNENSDTENKNTDNNTNKKEQSQEN